METFPYGPFVMNLGRAQHDLSSAAFKLLLTDSSYVPNINTDTVRADVVGEITGTGYTAGGLALTGTTWTWNATTRRGVLAANTAIWTGATFTARLAVAYIDLADPALDPLVCYIDFGADKSPVAEDWPITFPAGLLRLVI